MKDLIREFAPTVIFAAIVISMLTMTLTSVNTLHQTNGVDHAQLIGKLDLLNYKLGELDEDLDIHMNDSTIHIQPFAYLNGDENEGG